MQTDNISSFCSRKIRRGQERPQSGILECSFLYLKTANQVEKYSDRK